MAKYLITHIDLDGKMAGALGHYFNEYLHFDEILYKNYGFQAEPEILDLITPENTIWITDLSIPENTFIQWKSVLKEIKIWDHHISASENLDKYEDCDMDNARCGTKIFWEDCIRPLIISNYSKENLEKLDFLVNLTDVYDMWRKGSPLWLAATRLNRVCTLASQKVYGGTAAYFTMRFNQLLGEDTLKFDDTETQYYSEKEKELNDFVQKTQKELKVQTDKRGYKFGVIPTPAKISISLVADEVFDLIPDLDYLILWNDAYKNGLSLRARHGVNLTGLHGVYGHTTAAGVSGGPNVSDPRTIALREMMTKLRNGGWCLVWANSPEEKKDFIEVVEC